MSIAHGVDAHSIFFPHIPAAGLTDRSDRASNDAMFRPVTIRRFEDRIR